MMVSGAYMLRFFRLTFVGLSVWTLTMVEIDDDNVCIIKRWDGR